MNNTTEKALFKLLHIALEGDKNYAIPKQVNWEALLELSSAQGVIAIALDGLQRIVDADKEEEFEKDKQMMMFLYNMIGLSLSIENTSKSQYESAKKLSNLWAENDIRTLVLKGMAFGSYYPNPYHRQCVDMDCYLCGKYEEGNVVIERKGINVTKEDYRHSTFFFDNLHVENHKICTTVRGRRQRKKFEQYLRQLLEKEPTTQIEDSRLEIPCAMFNALYFLQHAHRHFLRESITLRHICDWAMILDKCGDDIDWQEFKNVAGKNDVLKFAESLTRLAYEVCGVRCDVFISDYTLQKQDRMLLDDCYAIADNMIQYGNNFKAHCQMVKNMINKRWKYKYFSNYSYLAEIIISVWGVFFEKEPVLD